MTAPPPPAPCLECLKEPARSADVFRSDACATASGNRVLMMMARRALPAAGDIPATWLADCSDAAGRKMRRAGEDCPTELMLPTDADALAAAFWSVALKAKWECWRGQPVCAACASRARQHGDGAECESLADLRAGKKLPPMASAVREI